MITRFAPSPTGRLHLGHVFSALTVWQTAKELGGVALLRVEDTDSTRSRAVFEEGIYEDLAWLGLTWPTPVRRQSEHCADYEAVLSNLADRGVLYPCSCSRRAIQAVGAKQGSDGYIYPGTCRHRTMSDVTPGDVLRLNIAKAFETLPDILSYADNGKTVRFDAAHVLKTLGDPVLKRKETGDPAYHLACTHDDAFQDITHVVRGKDISAQTPLHVLLQNLMGWPTPTYIHHDLVTGSDGNRLAKITNSQSVATYHEAGYSPDEVIRMAGWPHP